MGSTLTLNEGIKLDEETLTRIYSNESTILFTGVDGLTLGTTSYTSLTEDDAVLASTYFTNLNSDNYIFIYSGIDNGTLSLVSMNIPEPTSTALSVLGLAALAYRRRRK